MRSFKYSELHGWVKQISNEDGRIFYVNDVHEAVHRFLLARLVSCEYKYFITQRCWGFSFPIPYLNAQSAWPWAYLLLGDTVAGLSKQQPLSPKEASVKLELADPAFYNKLTTYLDSYGMEQLNNPLSGDGTDL